MNTETRLPRRLSRPHATVRTSVFVSLLTIVPLAAIAEQHASTSEHSRVADVSLVDLDLSTPQGMSKARDRLAAMARRVCAATADARELSNQPNFVACVDSTLANALRQVGGLTRDGKTVRNSVTRAANVPLADLDISTPEGLRAARGRLHTMAKRLCAELARSRDLSYQPNFEACVDHTLTSALGQVYALAAVRQSRTVQRAAP